MESVDKETLTIKTYLTWTVMHKATPCQQKISSI
jgi:hypothetical protein